MSKRNFAAWTMTIDGRPAHAEALSEVVNPSTGEGFAASPLCSTAQVDEAVAAAGRAFRSWSATPLDERRRLLAAYGARIRAESDELANLLTREQGKPLAKSKSEIAAALAYLDAYIGVDLPIEIIRDTTGQHVAVLRRPLGVVGAITAWNYPILLALWKIAPALATGNTIVLKPSPHTPLATLRLGEIGRDVLPAGVLNVIAGGNEAGERMTSHSDVRKVAFTGSAATGKRIMASAAPSLKRLTLELGGNDAGIVLDDVDPAKIADDLFWAKFSNCGQVCAALKRLYVHDKVFDGVCDSLKAVAAKVKVGDGFDESSQIGPIQNRLQRDKVREMRDEALHQGARVLFEGEAPDGPGFFFPVTLLEKAREGMRVVDEEVFGPVLPILRFSDEDEVLARANATPYGLGGSVWSADAERAAVLASRLETGSAWVNQHPGMGPDIPFGGVKESGIGVECGHWGMAEYTTLQVVNVKKT